MADTSAIRQLIPKSFHFDGYNELNCPNSRDKPFFGENTVEMGDYVLTTSLKDPEHLSIRFQAVCHDPNPKIFFGPYTLSFNYYLAKLQDALEKDCDFITFDIIPFYNGILRCDKCNHKTNHCSQLLKNCPGIIKAAVSFDRRDIEHAFSVYHGITKGGTTMKKKNGLFAGMLNLKFGICNNPNIRGTMWGVSIRDPKTGNWYIYDQATGTRKNMANIAIGNFPVAMVPVRRCDVVRSDLILQQDGTPEYVEANNGNTIQYSNPATGVIQEKIPEEGLIPGFNFLTKLVAFDPKTLIDPSSKKDMSSSIMTAILLMQWSKGNSGSEFTLDNINESDFNGMGALLPMLMASKSFGNLGNGFTNPDGTPNMLMLLALGNGDSNGNEAMQMFVLSQLFGGGNTPFAALTQPTTAGATFKGAQVACTNPGCGKIFDDPTVKYCSDCGAPTKPVVNTTDAKLVCTNPECESKGKVYENAKFCPQCGKPLSPVGPSTCRECGAPLHENAKFCTQCGTKVVPDTCPKCGAPYEDGAAFCSQCAHPLKTPPAPSEPKPEPPASDVTST